MESVVGIGHWALRVKDLDRSLEFYRDRLGFAEMLRLDRDGKVWIVYLRVTDTQFVELFPDAVGDLPPRDGPGVNHLCLEVGDLDATVASIERAGLELFRPISLGLDGNRQAWIEDPDGNRIELMEMSPTCLQAEAIKRLRG
jgi:lactoylglutathione lyase